MDLTGNGSIESLVGLIEFVSDVLIEDLSGLELTGGELKSEVEVPSVLCAGIAIKLVATSRSLETSSLG